jgi:D-alanyl-lipoteichoic acid acyltransferase DltB (MBOAT superfamily)
MQIISLPFLLFVAVTLIVYYLLARKAQNVWLLLASYFFYVAIRWEYALALLILTLVNFLIGRKVASKVWLWIGVGLDLSSFLLLKFISGPYGPRLLPGAPPDALHLLLPIGFSFYILQAISYLLDIHRGQAQPADDLVDFALYLSFFPKILAGPIERPARFLSGLQADRRVENVDFARSVGLLLIGLIRKVVVADRINALLPATVFSDPSAFSSLELTVWWLVFTFGLYNDFQGYTTIARGLAGLMGFDLSLNFRQPFISRSFSDFWTRWHISLSFWLRDYVFFPARRWLMQHRWPQWITILLPPLLTMLASGYWHGANAAMLLWGLLHGIYLVLEQFLKFPRTHETNKWRGALATALVFLLTSLAWIPFASSSLRAAFAYFTGMLAFTGGVTTPIPAIDLVTAALVTLWLDWQETKHESDAFFLKWTPAAQVWSVTLALWLLILYLGPQAGVVTFAYQGF